MKNFRKTNSFLSLICICSALIVILTKCNLIHCGIIPTDDIDNSIDPKKDTTLEFVYVLFRHGPRTPVSTYPNDPYKNQTYAPYGWGSLTNNGKVELYKIGTWLRKRYAHILGSSYKNDVIEAHSSYSPRTVMSMQLVLAGLFPPVNTPLEWNKLLNWQPIPIYTQPTDKDYLLRQNILCPRYIEALEEVMQLPEVLEQHEDYDEMLLELTNITGMNITRAQDVCSLYITLWAQKLYGLKLPAWTEGYFPEKMRYLAGQSYKYNAYTTEMRKIKGGYFLDQMLKDMDAVAAGTFMPKERRANIYCGHDWTITNVLSALDVWKWELPNFSALAAFELHKNHKTNEYYVEIYFQNDPNKEPEKVTIPDCEFQCPLKKLRQLLQIVLPEVPFKELCKAIGSLPGIEISSTEGIKV